jgi:hypothetical protein
MKDTLVNFGANLVGLKHDSSPRNVVPGFDELKRPLEKMSSVLPMVVKVASPEGTSVK